LPLGLDSGESNKVTEDKILVNNMKEHGIVYKEIYIYFHRF
jgi:hypothetical protein